MSNGIKSREYKLILASDRFADRPKGAQAFLDIVGRFAYRAAKKFDKQFKIECPEEEKRSTWYIDTADRHLDRAGFMLRVRHEEVDGQYKTAIKHRSVDRYIAASKNVSISRKQKKTEKFEEDILPPFRSLFSRSNSVRLKNRPELNNFSDAVALFPGLRSLADDDTLLEKPNGFVAREVFVKLCTLQFDKGEPEVKVGLSFWYRHEDDHCPVIAECAFDYQTKKGDDFPPATVEKSKCLFDFLQRHPDWFNPKATTKTRFVYDGASR
jgi:hypothetical protein